MCFLLANPLVLYLGPVAVPFLSPASPVSGPCQASTVLFACERYVKGQTTNSSCSFIFPLHKDRLKSLSSAIIICLMTSPQIPQITVSNQIKILIPHWKLESECLWGCQCPFSTYSEDNACDINSRINWWIREKMETVVANMSTAWIVANRVPGF